MTPRPKWPRPGRADRLSLLVVDDEELIREMLVRDLGGSRGDGYEVVAAQSYLHAVNELNRREQERVRQFDCVVSDLKMRGPSGKMLLDVVADRWPRCGRVLFSGYLEEEVFLGNALHHSMVAKATPLYVLTDAITHEIKLRSHG